ncbi:MAG TPA: hypothetical protein VE967_03910 [Gemmatimonadaceae bacterium]|nr:hypothetical protein [Gemmatimonadaceae bacterium]
MTDMTEAGARAAKDAAERRVKTEKIEMQVERRMEKTDKAVEKAVATALAHESNADPLTGAPGAHPLGTTAGAAGGAVAGAAVGTALGGPAGLVVGGIAGAVIGGLAGKGVAEGVNPTDDNAYWRENYKSRPYVKPDTAYDMYQPAYQSGWEARSQFADRPWDVVEVDLRSNWEKRHGQSTLTWVEASFAARDAFDRASRS